MVVGEDLQVTELVQVVCIRRGIAPVMARSEGGPSQLTVERPRRTGGSVVVGGLIITKLEVEVDIGVVMYQLTIHTHLMGVVNHGYHQVRVAQAGRRRPHTPGHIL